MTPALISTVTIKCKPIVLSSPIILQITQHGFLMCHFLIQQFIKDLNGVDHIITNVDDAKICVEWDHVKTDTYTGEGLINISGNTVTSVTPNEFRTKMKLPIH